MEENLPWQLLPWETSPNFEEWPTLRVSLPPTHTSKPPRVGICELSYAGTGTREMPLGKQDCQVWAGSGQGCLCAYSKTPGTRICSPKGGLSQGSVLPPFLPLARNGAPQSQQELSALSLAAFTQH